MIYTNFIFFIVAIATFAMSPGKGTNLVLFPLNLVLIVLSIVGFWIFNRNKFMKLRFDLENENISMTEAKRLFPRIITRNLAAAVFLFTLATYLFDLKKLLVQVPGIGNMGIAINMAGLLVFILYMAIVWYWAFLALGEVFHIGKSAAHYVVDNIKFNLVTVIPWLLFIAANDFFNIDNVPLLFQVGIFIAMMVILSIFSPLLIVWLWDCKPLEDGELKNEILTYCAAQGVKFKEIMSWNALNQSLVTAGVIGLLYPFRYLMLTPELMKMLNKDELMAVVSHETAHVKKKHMLYYLIFFIGFLVVSIGCEDWLVVLLTTPIGTAMRLSINDTLLNLFQVSVTIATFIIYFRFIFGFFMRNFERQADVFCFESGINPAHMIGSFMKLGGSDEGKKSNWHHFTISQRMEFINRCLEQPQRITAHARKLNRFIAGFMGVLIILAILSLYPNAMKTPYQINLSQIEADMHSRISLEPDNFKWYSVLGMVSFELQKWQQARDAYEHSLKLNIRQPEILNNLAWFYLTCPEQKHLDNHRALNLARDAIKLQQAPHIYDTLAEAYFQNGMYQEAYLAAYQALAMATENILYFKKQLEKMHKYYVKSKSSINI